MNLPRLGVRRPVLTTMVTLIVVVLGLVALSRLRIDLLPDVSRPTTSVRADYPGAAPEVVERRVTEILEEIISTVPGVEELTSTSSQGESRVTVRFTWGTDLDVVAQDLRARLEDELNELPDEVERPTLRKFDINSFPVVLLGVSSPLDPVELTRIVEEELRDRFARVPGVAQVDPWGGFPREIRVALHPDRLRALGLPLDAVVQGIADANLDLPAGSVQQGRYEVALRAPAEVQDLDTLAETVIAWREGVPVVLGQVADIVDTYEEQTRYVRVGEDPGLRLAIRKQADANTVEVATGVIAEAARIAAERPNLTLVPVMDQGNFIEQSITNVGRSVAYGGGFAVLVLLFFLRDLRSTAVVALSIPVSLVATFAVLYLGGFTLNLMTLGGLALGVGMMVDSAIVVLENVFQRREAGDGPDEAAMNGANEVGPALVASTLTTLVTFLPIVFFQGVAGLLFAELAYVIAFSLAVSLVVSLWVVPMLASRLPSSRERVSGPLARWATWAADVLARLDVGYARALGRVLDRRGVVLAGAGALLVLTALASTLLGTDFLPPSDEGQVRVTGEMALGTRIDLVDDQTRRIEAAVADEVPEALATLTTVSGGTSGDAEGEVQITLPPAGARSRSNVAIADSLRERLGAAIPGMEIRTRAPQGSFALNRLLGSSEDGVVVELRGAELDVLDELALEARDVVRTVPGVSDVQDTRPEGVPQRTLLVDRAKVADVGLRVRDVSELLQIAMAGTQVGEFRADGDAHRIFVQLRDARRQPIDEVLDLTVRTPTGDTVALRNLVRDVEDEGPIEIQRKDQERLVTLTAGIAGRPAGTVASDVADALSGLALPSGYRITLGGAYEAQQETFDEILVGLLLAVALVYMVLAAQYESLRDPLVVMVSVPFAGVGVVAALLLTGTTLNLQSGIGSVLLGGIVVNNAILLVDLAGRLHREGATVRDAALEAGRRRLRPILMTTATTLLGLLPLALGLGEGADGQAPLARAVVGGLAASTVLSLGIVPAVWTLAHREA